MNSLEYAAKCAQAGNPLHVVTEQERQERAAHQRLINENKELKKFKEAAIWIGLFVSLGALSITLAYFKVNGFAI